MDISDPALFVLVFKMQNGKLAGLKGFDGIPIHCVVFLRFKIEADYDAACLLKPCDNYVTAPKNQMISAG
ncbi:hypothetical protein LP421_11685 [Rhizobium sp. RCAM05350]|nr:hypothetical protein LP421_11685 [Rhizobium sp. RCAM05350]